MIKYCYKCKESKPILSFGKNKSKKDGLATECRECKKSQDKSYYQENSETVKQSVSKYRIANPEKVIQVKKSWYRKNQEYVYKKTSLLAKLTPEKQAIYKKKYKQNNKDKCNYLSSQRRAAKMQAIPPWFEKDLVATVYLKAQEWGFDVDHIVPLQGKTVCGLHCWSNLQLLDPEINARKSNVYWVDMP
jgi:hypothetical protein